MNKKKSNTALLPNQIVFYETEDRKISIAVRFENENVWLTKKSTWLSYLKLTLELLVSISKTYSPIGNYKSFSYPEIPEYCR
jgi:hypothetical protein